ncbi:MAG: VTT domain-containing protein [Verrucomicrobiota bacterium]
MLRHRLKTAALVFFGLVVAALSIFLWKEEFNITDVLRAKDTVLVWLQGTHPLVIFAAIAFLPLAGFPVSALLIAAGITYGGTVGMVISVLGIAVNNTLGYAIAARLRGPIQRWVDRKGIRVPEVPAKDNARIVLLFRIAPGFPLTFQNYLLGLARIPFWTYFWVSLAPQLIFITGFVLTGGALFEGRWGTILLGASLILVLAIVGRILYGQHNRKPQDHAAEPIDAP